MFREEFAKAKRVVVLTGAGVSAESGVPTFRGPGGFWRRWQVTDLATPEAFSHKPSLVWEFYQYRRDVMLSKQPNAAHLAIAECERRFVREGRSMKVVTQNIDELHITAGSTDVIQIHGSLFKVRCVKCGVSKVNRDNPICAALADKGAPDPDTQDAFIPVDELPRCTEAGCGGLLRPDVVWFGENLDHEVLESTQHQLDHCDFCIIVGTSSVVYPAAMFAPQVAERGVPVAEFNIEETPASGCFKYYFQGACGTTLPPALSP